MKQLLSCAALAVCSSTALAQFTYQIDDGSGLNAGTTQTGTMVWGNMFDAQQPFTRITTISVAFGRVIGEQVRVMLFADPTQDGNPDDAVLIASTTGVPAATASNTFTDFTIPPTNVSGKFFVAASAPIDGTNLSYSARTDFSSAAEGFRTFIYAGPNLNPLTLQGWAFRVQYTNNATVMVRASAQSRCPADIGQQGGQLGSDGLLDNNDFVVFIDTFFAQNAAADIGSQGGVSGSDGAWDNNDFVVFIDRFFTPC